MLASLSPAIGLSSTGTLVGDIVRPELFATQKADLDVPDPTPTTTPTPTSTPTAEATPTPTDSPDPAGSSDAASPPQIAASDTDSPSATDSAAPTESPDPTDSAGDSSGGVQRGPSVALNPSSYDVLVQPGQLTQALLNSKPGGTRFALAAGVHRLTGYLDVPSGDQLLGFAGAVISGGKDISSGWTSDGAGHWYVGGQTPISPWVYSSPDGVSVCGVNPNCHLAADVWLNHRALMGVASLGALTSGSFFFDQGAGRIYLADNPAGQQVETNGVVLTTPGRSGVIQGTNVTFQNLVIEEMGTNQWGGAMLIQGSSVVDHCKVWLNHMDGVSGYGNTTVSNSILTHNGENGVVNAVHMVVNNEISYNNENGYNVGWNGSGLKFSNPGTSNTTISGNWVHHNHSDGIWLDTVGTNNLIENNTVEYNDIVGIGIEVGPENVVRGNVVRDNGSGMRAASSGWWVNGVGIQLSDSSGSQVYGNWVYDNANGPITLVMSWGRTNSDGQAGGSSNQVYGNWEGFVNSPHSLYTNDYQSDPSNSLSGALCTIGGSTCNPFSTSSWKNNAYYFQSAGVQSAPWFVWDGGVMTFAQWQAAGRDAGSTSQVGSVPVPAGAGAPVTAS